MPPNTAPSPPRCNVTYTKTVTTITMEPTGNVTHVDTTSYVIPCAEAPALPPAGAPDSGEPIITRTMRTLPLAAALQSGGVDGSGDGADSTGPGLAPIGAFPPGLDPVRLPPLPLYCFSTHL